MENTMLIRTANLKFIPLISLISIGFLQSAHAQGDDVGGADDAFAEEEEGDGSGEQEELVPVPVDLDAVKHGIGLRLRYIFFPKALIEVFIEEAASGVSRSGFGLEYVRRKKDFEISVGFEYDTLAPDNGFYVERGGDPLEPGSTDFIRFDGLAWYTIDAAFVYHYELSSMISLRYGGGIGFGIVTGDVIETDAVCTGSDTQDDCIANQNGAQVNEKQDFFRYPPVLNVIGGVQFTPAKNVAVNLEIGMRTIFYSGIGVHYYF